MILRLASQVAWLQNVVGQPRSMAVNPFPSHVQISKDKHLPSQSPPWLPQSRGSISGAKKVYQVEPRMATMAMFQSCTMCTAVKRLWWLRAHWAKMMHIKNNHRIWLSAQVWQQCPDILTMLLWAGKCTPLSCWRRVLLSCNLCSLDDLEVPEIGVPLNHPF